MVSSDDVCVAIRDAYPKACHHFLILPKDNISSLGALGSNHVPLLKHLLAKGKELVRELTAMDEKLKFRYGYHAIPSMTRLHMHVISQDFNSPCLKTKKHWNSFTTEYFIDAENIISMLEKDGKLHFDRTVFEAILKRPLQCHICRRNQQNLPKLKEHIRTHDDR